VPRRQHFGASGHWDTPSAKIIVKIAVLNDLRIETTGVDTSAAHRAGAHAGDGVAWLAIGRSAPTPLVTSSGAMGRSGVGTPSAGRSTHFKQPPVIGGNGATVSARGLAAANPIGIGENSDVSRRT
jgi:hypothetical protein